ncbi:acyl-CoA dehydrogenase [Oxalicibacterium flavum]|uniref:Acyl-CoA dehydrogenase n=1 Tax=Oxalicibacterium flavum TaxID=179467 RepID=A0A8J2XVA3_9BURK|nr:acyl-CoA dehydrogenase family protein [Oxalicibacterium flavum]GGC11622.1 acyl-CoA dehydrogenase [Oxalicibacterium flavum]
MSAVPETRSPILSCGQESMLAAVRRIASGPLAAMADEIDRAGTYPKTVLMQLGEAGAYKAHMAAGGTDYGAAIQAIAEVSRVCAATGFMVWCHDVCGLYMEESGNPVLQGALLHAHMNGQTLGGTGLSNPMKSLAGIEAMLLRARKVDGGYLVNGTLPWVSNLGDDHYFGAIAAVEDDEGHELMFVVDCASPNAALRTCPSFAGMEGTGTWGVRLTDYFVGAHNLVADPVRPFIARIRAAFILLQCGMGLGVAQGAIDSMWEVEQQLGHVNQFLEDRPDALQAELDALDTRVMALARTPFATDTQYLIDVLDARAHASEIALRAAQSALLHQGARGYLLSSAVQRRVRESHFVAIVTPALKHLRKEMARLSEQELPA